MTWKDDFYNEFVYQYNESHCIEGAHHVVEFDTEAKFITSTPKLRNVISAATHVDFTYDGDQAGYSENTKLVVVDEFGKGHTLKYDIPLHTFMDKVLNKNIHPLRKAPIVTVGSK